MLLSLWWSLTSELAAEYVVQEMRTGQLADKESTVLRVNADSADSEASTGTDFDPSESRLCGGTHLMDAGMPGSSELKKQ